MTPAEAHLVETHLALVARVARRLRRRLPRDVDVRDLESVGVLGLIDAARRFDPARGVPFGAYAQTRITGAIRDWQRAQDPLSRSQRSRGRTVVIVSLDSASVEGASLAADVVDAQAEDVLQASLLDAERAWLVRRAVARLPWRERTAVRLYYEAGWPGRAIGHALRCSESRVSQLLAGAKRRLRRSLGRHLR